MNWMDPDRLAAALAAAFGSSIMGLLAFTAVVFSVPPPTRRQLWRAVVEVVLGLYAAIGAGYAAGAPLAAFINGLGAKVVPGFSAVDPLVGGYRAATTAGLEGSDLVFRGSDGREIGRHPFAEVAAWKAAPEAAPNPDYA